MNRLIKICALSIVIAFNYVSAAPQQGNSFIDIPNSIDIGNLIQTIKGSTSQNPQQEDIPEGGAGYMYGMGTGPIDRINLPPVLKITDNYKAGWSAGFGYSCGKFDPFANVEQMVNKAIDKFKQLPQMFVSAAQEAVASLPAYALNKINPTLYNTVTKNLDDAFNLFDIKIKSCKELESGIANHGNSYFDYFKAAKADRQRVEVGNNDGGETIDETQKKVDEGGADNGIVGAGGERKGGKDQDPFDAMEEILIAGYNMLIGRADTTDKSPAPDNTHPITKVFKSPVDAQKFAASIYGNRQWKLANDDSQTKAQPGVSFRYQYQTHRHHMLQLMSQLVKKETPYATFVDKTGGVQLAPAEIDDLRSMEPYTRDIALMLRSQGEGIRDMQHRLRFIREIALAGLEEPSIAQSTAASKVKQEIMELVGRIDQNLYELSVMNEQG